MSYMRQKDYRRYFKTAYQLLGEAAEAGYPDYRVYIKFRPEELATPEILERRKILYNDYLGFIFAAAARDMNMDLVAKIEKLNYQANRGGVGKI